MSEKEFNLLDEPWIRVMTLNGETEEQSLLHVLCYAQEYKRLAGELPAQDFAVMRLLLAVVQTVIYRYDEDDEESLLDEPQEAVKRWRRIWKGGCLPSDLISEYLTEWHERFWLFHPERPFYQVTEAANGTEASAAKLNGEISESNNKIRLFANRNEAGKNKLTFSEAARWLLYLNGYDDTSAKPKKKGLLSPGAGWLGKMGIVFAEGENLFETLMLNTVLLETQNCQECWEEALPTWELEKCRNTEREEISIPNNQAELLTLQSRRILLKRTDNNVDGYNLLGGDFFQKDGSINEQMTFWRVTEERNKTLVVSPRRNNPNKQMWRDFANLVIGEKDGYRPGIVKWVEFLKRKNCIDNKKLICFRTASVQYGDKDFFVTDVFGDNISFSLDILTEFGLNWVRLINDEIGLCDKAAYFIKCFEDDLQKAAGNTSGKYSGNAVEQYYYLIDQPFRKWLLAIEPNISDREQEISKWRKQALKIATDLGKKMLQQAGEKAFVGRKEEGEYYSSASAHNKFLWSINGCFKIKKEADNG